MPFSHLLDFCWLILVVKAFINFHPIHSLHNSGFWVIHKAEIQKITISCNISQSKFDYKSGIAISQLTQFEFEKEFAISKLKQFEFRSILQPWYGKYQRGSSCHNLWDGLAEAETLAQATAALKTPMSNHKAQLRYSIEVNLGQIKVKCAFGANKEISSARN